MGSGAPGRGRGTRREGRGIPRKAFNKRTWVKFYRPPHSAKNPGVGSLARNSSGACLLLPRQQENTSRPKRPKADPASHSGVQDPSHAQRQPPALRTPAHQSVTPTPVATGTRQPRSARSLRPREGAARTRAPSGRGRRRGGCRDRTAESLGQLGPQAPRPVNHSLQNGAERKR